MSNEEFDSGWREAIKECEASLELKKEQVKQPMREKLRQILACSEMNMNCLNCGCSLEEKFKKPHRGRQRSIFNDFCSVRCRRKFAGNQLKQNERFQSCHIENARMRRRNEEKCLILPCQNAQARNKEREANGL